MRVQDYLRHGRKFLQDLVFRKSMAYNNDNSKRINNESEANDEKGIRVYLCRMPAASSGSIYSYCRSISLINRRTIMSDRTEQLTVVFEPERKRSAAYADGKYVGECAFTVEGGVWNITHTGVDPAFGGRGIAKMLVLKVIEEARRQQVRINPICSYAKRMMEGKEEYSDVLKTK